MLLLDSKIDQKISELLGMWKCQAMTVVYQVLTHDDISPDVKTGISQRTKMFATGKKLFILHLGLC